MPAAAMAVFPFILVKKKAFRQSASLIRHEKIHLMQQIELLLLPFYILYLLHYLVNLFKFKNHELAYQQIAFEKEAYFFEHEEKYLSERKPFAWFHLKNNRK